MHSTKADVLAHYHVGAADLLGRGMEAEVYGLDPDRVLKFYDGTASLPELRALQQFYATLDRSRLAYALPTIDHVAANGQFLIVIEQRLAGRPLAEVVRDLTPQQHDQVFQIYVAAVQALACVAMPAATSRYKLFDADRLSERSDGDWHAFLARYLAHKLRELTPFFQRDVVDFTTKLEAMNALLAQPYNGDYTLIHGDLFPGNMLVDEAGHVTALLDFGLLTMFGDPYFDLATAWVFFDMYDELHLNIRERLLAVILDQVGQRALGLLYRYVLLYSLLSANSYSSQCSDGHYRWCVANLNTQLYWQDIG